MKIIRDLEPIFEFENFQDAVLRIFVLNDAVLEDTHLIMVSVSREDIYRSMPRARKILEI